MTRDLEIALVNNMPDAALASTHLQFSRLLRAAANGRPYTLHCYTLPRLSRGDAARRYLARGYADIDTLYRRGADALIVTGCEPRAPRLQDEPYWPHLAALVDWARDHTATAIWSCLAAHAATLRLTGVERQAEAGKISGVYRFECAPESWLKQEGTHIVVPHSRYNGLSRETLEQQGFHIGSSSAEVGVDMFWREEPSLFVFLQGHPEYDADTLLKEYRRDVMRYIDGERSAYPNQPANFFAAEPSAKLEDLRMRLEAGVAPEPARALGEILAAQHCNAVWAPHSQKLIHDWLCAARARIAAHRQSA